uniref:Uncharacterized protein n=1 Tax=Cacopsylla melanoneura TaxID=428564 RepID=A0A8D8VN42_9HEMI
MLRISFFRSLGVLSACSLLGVILRISFFRSLGVTAACSLLGAMFTIFFLRLVGVLSPVGVTTGVGVCFKVISRSCSSLIVSTDSGFITCELTGEVPMGVS